MTSRFGWTLAVGIILLLTAVGLLTNVLLQLSISKRKPLPEIPKIQQQAPQAAEPVAPVPDNAALESLRLKVPEEPVVKPVQSMPEPAVETKKTDTAVQKPVEPRRAVATVTEVKGFVFATEHSGKRRILKVGSEVFAKERVDTDTKSRVVLKFSDGTTIHQGEQGVFVMEDYLFDPADKKNTHFEMSFLKGFCRIVTGKITKIRQDSFKVRTRMAIVGVRGCEIGIKSRPKREDVYVVSVATNESVVVDTTVDGRLTMNPATREAIIVEASKQREFDVDTSGRVVTIINGSEPEERQCGLKEIDELISGTSGLRPADHSLKLREEASLFTIKPLESKGEGAGK